MAVAPLFLPDMTTLKARSRLTGAANADVLALLDGCVLAVRVGFFQRLGATRVAAIVAMTRSDTPSTANELTRCQAELCELAWIRLKILPKVLTRFVDGGQSALQGWNEQAAALGVNSPNELRNEIDALQAEVNEALDVLAGVAEVSASIRAAVLEPDDVPDLPGATALYSRRNPANHVNDWAP